MSGGSTNSSLRKALGSIKDTTTISLAKVNNGYKDIANAFTGARSTRLDCYCDNAKVVTDRVSGYSKGFGFVTYSTVEGATAGIEGMDGKFLDGWVIFAEYARPRPVPGAQQNYGNPSYTRNSPYGGNPYGQQ